MREMGLLTASAGGDGTADLYPGTSRRTPTTRIGKSSSRRRGIHQTIIADHRPQEASWARHRNKTQVEIDQCPRTPTRRDNV